MVIKLRDPISLPPQRRAVNADMKGRRRADILTAALRLLERQPFEDIGVAAIARECGLAKGTVYLYFSTREALFLELLATHYVQWFDTLDARLDGMHARVPALAHAIADSLQAQAMFLRLVGVLHGVLEHNVPVAQIVRFKLLLLERATHTGGVLEQALELRPGTGLRLLLWLQAVVPGLAQMAAPAAPVRAALDRDASLAPLDIDFAHELDALLSACIRGLQASPEKL